MLISVVIAEDHDVTREGLHAVVTDRLDGRVSAATGDGQDVLPLLKEHEPDLLILDLGLPGLRGLEILKRTQRLDFPIAVVVLSMHAEDTYVAEALRRGASAYVLKGSPLQELLDGIRAAVNGDRFLSSSLPEQSLVPSDPDREPGSRFSTLTERERDVLQLIAEGLTSKEIGERLHISPRTVGKHRQNLKAKLDLNNTAELTRFFLREGPSRRPPPE